MMGKLTTETTDLSLTEIMDIESIVSQQGTDLGSLQACENHVDLSLSKASESDNRTPPSCLASFW